MRSMTGYGRGQLTQDTRMCSVEIRAVNHRYLDLAPRISKKLLYLETAINQRIKARISRGHLDIYIDYKNTDPGKLLIDEKLVECYKNCIAIIGEHTGNFENPPPSFYATLPDVIRIEPDEDDSEVITDLVLSTLDIALDDLVNMREREGSHLKKDIQDYLFSINSIVEKISVAAPEVPEKYHKRLINRLTEMHLENFDETRILQEVALMADRCAIDEEISRLRSHLNQAKLLSDHESECGKQFDFIIQEMNREMNTIGSKASDESISKMVIQGKALIEKLREQIQNVE